MRDFTITTSLRSFTVQANTRKGAVHKAVCLLASGEQISAVRAA